MQRARVSRLQLDVSGVTRCFQGEVCRRGLQLVKKLLYTVLDLLWRLTDTCFKTYSYNDDGVIAVIRAAEKKKSPAVIQLFPWTLRFQGPEFVKYVVSAAHSASVPIAVHLDHCIKQEDIELALTLPFDSIMIDAATLDENDDVALCAENVRRASRVGITVEVEIGRIEGGEDGLPNVDQGAIHTDPQRAREFMSKTGAHFLAPSFGNIHGGYPPGGLRSRGI